jgi:diadenosine tetraphosphatase ApaH/serine/threonine PP2A family protein phosphatase
MSISKSPKDLIYQRRMEEKDAEVTTLQERVECLSHQLSAALQAADRGQKRRFHPLSPHAINVREVRTSTNKRTIQSSREKMGRTASIATRQVLDNIVANEPDSGNPPLIQRILDMFQRPSAHMDYLNSQEFAKDLLKLASKVKQMLEREPRVVFLQSPAYVFGDIHGNLEDLHFFSDNIWRLGMSLTAGNFLFLGDYVDRGLNCLECVAYLFAMKLQLPGKVFMLRGNHETRDVNGWEEHYGERSFIYQCRNRFGDDLGYRLWEACNQVFDRLPLAAVIDQDIFCVHGGIPRPVSSSTTRIQDILTVPRVAGINPPYEHEDDDYQQVASDCVWSDPASEDQEMTTVDFETGFGDSLRGGGAICFGNKAVTDFLQQQDFSYIMRAHEAHAEGVAISKGARVFTVFSTSQDHNQGSNAMAGCILVDNDKLQVINRSPAYKNQYVHRRDSVSLAALSEQEIQKRIKLGLITAASSANQSDEDVEDWDDFDDSEEEQEDDAEKEDYTFSEQRRSSVDLNRMSGNSHDDTDWESGTANAINTSSDFEPNKKHRFSQPPSVAPIDEEGEDDIATVDGDDDIMVTAS